MTITLSDLQCSNTHDGERCCNWREHVGGCSWTEPKYSQQQLDAAVAAARRDAFEEAAKLVLSDEGSGDIDFIAQLLRAKGAT